jgi:hypothetical protein
VKSELTSRFTRWPCSSTNGYLKIPARAEVERQVAARAPFVLHEETEGPARQRRLARAVGKRRLLRQPEQEIGEIESAPAGERASVAGVNPGEHKLAVGVALVVRRGLVVIEHAACLDLVPAERPAPGDVGADAIAN